MPYTTKLLNAQNEAIDFQTVVKPSLRGKKHQVFEIYIREGNERKLVGAMDYNLRPHCIHINRMDNLQNGFTQKNKQMIKHMGYLFLEHALRESFAKGFQGKLELEAIENSPIVYFKFGLRKNSRTINKMIDVFDVISMIENFNESIPMDQRKELSREMMGRLCFGGLFLKEEDKAAQKDIELALDKMLAGETQGEVKIAKKQLFHLLEQHIKLNNRTLWEELVKNTALHLNIPKAQCDTLPFNEILEYGCQSSDNLEFSSWLMHPDTSKLTAEEFASQYSMQLNKCIMRTYMHLPESFIHKKRIELQIDPQKPFDGIEHFEDKRIPLVEQMIDKLGRNRSSRDLLEALNALKQKLLSGKDDPDSLKEDLESIRRQIEQRKKDVKTDQKKSKSVTFWSVPTVDELLQLVDQIEEVAKKSTAPNFY